MAHIVVHFDPKDRLSTGHPHLPHDIAYAVLRLDDEALPDDPDQVKALSEKLAGLLLAALTG